MRGEERRGIEVGGYVVSFGLISIRCRMRQSSLEKECSNALISNARLVDLLCVLDGLVGGRVAGALGCDRHRQRHRHRLVHYCRAGAGAGAGAVAGQRGDDEAKAEAGLRKILCYIHQHQPPSTGHCQSLRRDLRRTSGEGGGQGL